MYDLSEEIMRKRCVILVTALVGKEYRDSWWYKHNTTLKATPQELWNTDPTKVYQYLMGSVDIYV